MAEHFVATNYYELIFLNNLKMFVAMKFATQLCKSCEVFSVYLRLFVWLFAVSPVYPLQPNNWKPVKSRADAKELGCVLLRDWDAMLSMCECEHDTLR